jgi:hypothetical protein
LKTCFLTVKNGFKIAVNIWTSIKLGAAVIGGSKERYITP